MPRVDLVARAERLLAYASSDGTTDASPTTSAYAFRALPPAIAAVRSCEQA